MSKLLPCPFCASTLVRQGIAVSGAVIYCQVCFAQGPATPTVDGLRAYQEVAAMGWNKAPRTAPTLAVRLETALGFLRRHRQALGHATACDCPLCKFLAAIDAESAGGTR